MRQLPLDLGLPPRHGRGDYVVAPSNAAALTTIDLWPNWPDSLLVLLGPPGAGKSHLAAIWAERAAAELLRRDHDLTSASRGLSASQAFLIDDADALAFEEASLFHLVNIVRESGASMLLTAREAPDTWGLRTADLLSRLRLAPTVRLDAPDDALMEAVLAKLFADRQLVVDDTVIAYLVARLDRSIDEARATVEALDRTGLALHRRVTRPMAAMIVAERERARDAD